MRIGRFQFGRVRNFINLYVGMICSIQFRAKTYAPFTGEGMFDSDSRGSLCTLFRRGRVQFSFPQKLMHLVPERACSAQFSAETYTPCSGEGMFGSVFRRNLCTFFRRGHVQFSFTQKLMLLVPARARSG